MNPIDVQTFNQAIAMAQAGQKQDAYGQIKSLYYNYPENTDVLLWMAYTTADLGEAEWAINRAATIAPGNGRVLQALEWLAKAKANQWSPPPAQAYMPPTSQALPYVIPAPQPQPFYPPAPVVYQVNTLGFQCPYCRTNMPPIVRQRISVGGWVVFAVLLTVCFPLCWIGLLMKEDQYQCVQCGVNLG
jgi:hypothetical protein